MKPPLFTTSCSCDEKRRRRILVVRIFRPCVIMECIRHDFELNRVFNACPLPLPPVFRTISKIVQSSASAMPEIEIGPERLPASIPEDMTPPNLAEMMKSAKAENPDAADEEIASYVATTAANKMGWWIEVNRCTSCFSCVSRSTLELESPRLLQFDANPGGPCYRMSCVSYT